jgi:hypothetical protein
MDPQPSRAVASWVGLRDGRVVPGRVVVLGLALAVVPGPAHADGESALSGSLSWATYSLPGQNDMDVTSYLGAQLAVEYERAFAEPLSWRVELGAAGFHHADGKSWLAIGDAGVVYRFDVLKYVPYAFAGVGAVIAGGGPLPSTTEPILMLGGGLDILASRERSWGFELRLASFAGSVTTFSFGVRGTLRWGFF